MKRLMAVSEVLDRDRVGVRVGKMMHTYRIQRAWPDIVGASLAEHTFPFRVAGGTLLVGVDNPAWAQHLSMMREEILVVVESRTGRKFRDLKFVSAPCAPKPRPRPAPIAPSPPRVFEPSSLDELMRRVRERALELRKARQR